MARWFCLTITIIFISRGIGANPETVSRFGSFGEIGRQEQFQTWMKLKEAVQATLEESQLDIEDNRLDLQSIIRRWLHDLMVRFLTSSFPTAVANVSAQCQMDSIAYVHNLYTLNGSWARQSNYSSSNDFFRINLFNAKIN